VEALYTEIPSGVGSKGAIRLSPADYRRVIEHGARWAVEAGMGSTGDLERTESHGAMEGADESAVSAKALERGRAQLGTLGSGNHFVELQYVDEIYDRAAAEAFGLHEGQVTVMIHTGSRGFGHQVCTDSVAAMARAAGRFGIVLPDRELACAPMGSPEAERYLGAMKAAANYAWANRQIIMHRAGEALMRALGVGPRALGLSLLYDVAHNIAKEEMHVVDGKARRLMVHRKGATRSFGPGHVDVPEAYRRTGQPVLIPGDMGRASYVLAGTEEAMRRTWGSTCHGAGRVLSRHQAERQARGRAIWRELEDSGVIVRAAGRGTLGQEMPEAYKDVDQVVDVVDRAGISRKVARLKPMGVVKG
jgi:tRNA-splicing ligase RtcB